ncbi:restriction endonuclease PLD domain-containing protein [Spirochaeta africana]|uniref:restriction endonuclease PLD domain-containing protein n=1 Tax=Spirochaeta africana TaxID=46355 RepID=UPI000A041561|nr:restriction endonuclease PLD domain-containing protein [Spirochaeta africana]
MFLPTYVDYPYERLPLTIRKGNNEQVPYTSGLNWGQRPGRNQDQAYLAVPAHIQKSGFFPLAGEIFKVYTDDGEIWDCARRQANGKAIHTIDDNSKLGLYFRKRLNLYPGDLITINHLLNYGRTSVEFYKKSRYEFILDFNSYK